MSKKRDPDQPRPAAARRPPRPQVRRSRLPGWVLPVTMTAAALVIIFAGLVLYSRLGSSPTTAAQNGAAGAPTGQAVDGIQCQTSEQVAYHIHAHLAVFANGQPRTIPLGIGIPNTQTENTTAGPFAVSGSCFYWLHSHETDGVIHIESPDQRTFTLGNWFHVWGQTLSTTQVAGDSGAVIAYVNGQRYTGDPGSIRLTEHAVIQLDVGTDVPPRPYTFANGL